MEPTAESSQFKFFDPEDTRYYWGPILGHSFPVETIAFHNDPFFAECRAYGRIKEAQAKGMLKRGVAVRCEGFLLPRDEDKKFLERKGVDFEEQDVAESGDDDSCGGGVDDQKEKEQKDFVDRPQKLRKRRGSRPVRAIVKELASTESGVKARSLRRILRDIRLLSRPKIYNRDVCKDNFRNKKLVDFGSSWTEPHCILEADEDEAAETRVEDLVMFDEMVAIEALKTDVRATSNWLYCNKLRPGSPRPAAGVCKAQHKAVGLRVFQFVHGLLSLE
ncbi:hypothetical protein CDD83_6338 [Cordyceps sp. RAO-2017]|nr:hypothetical protein CDD83_6338 [Cordyceps sp. RAO-2017]